MRLTGIVAVITGAAHGLGRALAADLLARGCDLALADLDEGPLEELRANGASRGRRVLASVVDVSAAGQVETFAREVRRTLGPAKLLVNNAGVSVQGSFQETPPENLRWLMDVNFWGVVHGCRSFVPQLCEARPSRIVNVLSAFALTGFPSKSGYCASKHAVRGFSEALRADLQDAGVGVSVVYPPAIRTDLLLRSRGSNPEKTRRESEFLRTRGWPPEAVAARILRSVERNRNREVIGTMPRAVDWLLRLSPSFGDAAIRRIARRLPFV